MNVENSSSGIINKYENDPNSKSKERIRKGKEFMARNSPLVDLYEINHFSSIRHLCMATLILIVMYTIICNIAESGSSKFGFHYIFIGFQQFHKTVMIWIAMFCYILILYPVFCLWANYRGTLSPKSSLLWDQLCLSTFLIYLVFFFCFPPYYVLQHDLLMASSATVISEQVRLIMKIHAYVRTNVSRAKSYRNDKKEFSEVATFSNYVYFLFAPTLIYRDEYPRTKHIRWSFVAVMFLEVAAIIFLYGFLVANYVDPTFKDFHLKAFNWITILRCIFNMILPSVIYVVTLFHMVFHSWLNAWAEMLRFADRLFYLDWWNSTTYAEYYRKIDVVVYDYIHTYIYRDLYEIVLPGNKMFATCGIILMSAIMHEYVLGMMLGTFIPVMLIMYSGFGILFSFINVKSRFWGNLYFWLTFCFGIGAQCTLYTVGYYTRINCPKNIVNFSDYFVPNIFYCNSFQNK